VPPISVESLKTDADSSYASNLDVTNAQPMGLTQRDYRANPRYTIRPERNAGNSVGLLVCSGYGLGRSRSL